VTYKATFSVNSQNNRLQNTQEKYQLAFLTATRKTNLLVAYIGLYVSTVSGQTSPRQVPP